MDMFVEEMIVMKDFEKSLKSKIVIGIPEKNFLNVILPKDTRRKLLKAFSMLENKVVDTPKRKHGNIPL